jgi:hypothetical protein
VVGIEMHASAMIHFGVTNYSMQDGNIRVLIALSVMSLLLSNILSGVLFSQFMDGAMSESEYKQHSHCMFDLLGTVSSESAVEALGRRRVSPDATKALFDGKLGMITDKFQRMCKSVLDGQEELRQSRGGTLQHEDRQYQAITTRMTRKQAADAEHEQKGVDGMSRAARNRLENAHSKRKGRPRNIALSSDITSEEATNALLQSPRLQKKVKISVQTKRNILFTKAKDGPNRPVRWNLYWDEGESGISAGAAANAVYRARMLTDKDTGPFTKDEVQRVAVACKQFHPSDPLYLLRVVEVSHVQRSANQVWFHLYNKTRAAKANAFKSRGVDADLVVLEIVNCYLEQTGMNVEEISWDQVAAVCGTGTKELALAAYLRASPRYLAVYPHSSKLQHWEYDETIKAYLLENHYDHVTTEPEVCRKIAMECFQPSDGAWLHSSTLRNRMRTMKLNRVSLDAMVMLNDTAVCATGGGGGVGACGGVATTGYPMFVQVVRSYCDTHTLNIEGVQGHGLWPRLAAAANVPTEVGTKLQRRFYIHDDRFATDTPKTSSPERERMINTIRTWMHKRDLVGDKVRRAPITEWRALAKDCFQLEHGKWRHSVWLKEFAGRLEW